MSHQSMFAVSRTPGCWLVIIFTLLCSVGAHAQLAVENPFVRELPPGQAVTAVYFTLKNTGKDNQTLIGAQTEVAKRAELHTHLHKDGKMQMRQVFEVELPGGSELSFEPGGYHIMLFDLNRELRVGDKVPLTLKFSSGIEYAITAEVYSMKAVRAMKKAAHHHHH